MFCVDCKFYGGVKYKPPVYVSDWCSKLEIYLPDVIGYAKTCDIFSINKIKES